MERGGKGRDEKVGEGEGEGRERGGGAGRREGGKDGERLEKEGVTHFIWKSSTLQRDLSS